MLDYIQLYTSLATDLDFQTLENTQRLAWYEILLFAAAKGGFTPSVRAMGTKWGLSEAETLTMLGPLVEFGWIIVHDDCIEVVNWNGRQVALKNQKQAQRQREYRERLKTRESDVTVTSPLRHRDITPITRDITPITEVRLEEKRREEKRREENPPTIVGVAPEDSGPRVVGKRDKAIALYWDLFRFLFNRRARDVTFWGRTALSDKYRRRAKNLVATLGNDAYKGLLGNRLNPYWQDKATGVVSFSLENALSEKASANGLRYYNQNIASCERLKEEFNEWIRQPGNDSSCLGADGAGSERGKKAGGTVSGAVGEGGAGICSEG